jgi:hypothetical protein
MRSIGISIHGQRQAEGFLKRSSAKHSWRITQLEQKPVRHNDNKVNRTLSFRWTIIENRVGKQSQVQQM